MPYRIIQISIPPPDGEWLQVYGYRKYHRIYHSYGAGENYQIMIRAFMGSGFDNDRNVYLNYHCKEDFSDVRFTRSDGVTFLSYWIERKLDGYYADFWVKIPDSLDENDIFIYIYYGNPNSTSLSNGENTFIFFDSFETDFSKWDNIENMSRGYEMPWEGSFSAQNKEGVSRIGKNIDIENVAYGIKYIDLLHEPLTKHGMGIYGTTLYHIGVDEDFSIVHYVYRYSMTYVVTNVMRTWGWHNFEIGVVSDKTYYFIDYNLVANLNMGGRTSYIGFGSSWERNQEWGYWDCVYLRKFIYPEPSHGEWGLEEVQ